MSYEFTSDWFTDRIPTFERQLLPWVGQPLRCLEVGAHEGRSALWLLEHLLTNPRSILTCIDTWDDSEIEQRFDHNVSLSPRPSGIKKLHGPSSTIMRVLPVDSFDFIYVDGSHEGLDVLTDAVLAFDLLKVGGILAFDDYLWHLPDECHHPPKPAIDAFLLLWEQRIELLEQGWQVWVRKR